jgi:predicted DNA-binding transcriptional regulator YafY
MSISLAIQNRNLLSFSYDGFTREVEPHCLGIDKKGHPALRAYQVAGGSESGTYVGWKFFHVNEIRNLHVLSKSFQHPRQDYKRGDKDMMRIQTEV